MSFLEDYPGVIIEDADQLSDTFRDLPADSAFFVVEFNDEYFVGLSTQDAAELEKLMKAMQEAIELVAV